MTLGPDDLGGLRALPSGEARRAMWVIRACIILQMTFCARASTPQIPPCTTEVIDALREEGAQAEPSRMANIPVAHCLADGPGKLTLLHEAARAGAYGSIRRLIERGADPFAADRRGATPLHWAAAQGFDKAVEALLESLSAEKRMTVLEAVDLEGSTPLDNAEANSRIRAATALVRNGAMRGGVVLNQMEGSCSAAVVDAVLLGNVDLVKLLKPSVTVSSIFSAPLADCTLNSDPREWSLIHLATAVAVLSLAPSSDSSVDIVKELLAQGADPTREDAYGQTPLFFAVKSGRLDLVQLLLESSPHDVNHLDVDKQTPLLRAAMAGREEVAKLLLTKGADATQQDREGLSARDWALENGHDNVLDVLDALPVVPRGVRGSNTKSLSRTAFPRQEFCIFLLILLLAGLWSRCRLQALARCKKSLEPPSTCAR